MYTTRNFIIHSLSDSLHTFLLPLFKHSLDGFRYDTQVKCKLRNHSTRRIIQVFGNLTNNTTAC